MCVNGHNYGNWTNCFWLKSIQELLSWANNSQQNLQLAKSVSTRQKPLFTIGENWKVTQCAKRVFNDYTFGWQEAPPHQNFEWWTHLNLLWQHLPPRVRLHFPKCFTRYSLSSLLNVVLYSSTCSISSNLWVPNDQILELLFEPFDTHISQLPF